MRGVMPAPRIARAILRAGAVRAAVLAAVLAAAPASGAAMAQAAGSASDEADAVRSLVAKASLLPLKRPDFAAYRSALDTFYATSAYAPRWTVPNAPWRAVLDELAAAPTHGLDASDYDVDWLRREFEAIAAGDRAAERRPRADVALTVSLFRLLSDLHSGRVTPERAGFSFKVSREPFDLAAVAQTALATGNVHGTVVGAEPSFPLYLRLEEALARYRKLAAEPLQPLPPLPAKLRKIDPGGPYEGTAAIAGRLRRTGDLPADAALAPDHRYDGALVDAVRAFQDRQGLKPDGVLGRDTLAALSVPFSARVRQLELSLERLRWLPDFEPGPLIAVNIPSFRLWAFATGRGDVAAKLTMPVIVGVAANARKTPVFIGEMRYVEFSPYWNVTPSIQRGEVVPRLRRDPAYWQRENFEAVRVDGNGEPITVLDAATIEGLASGALRVRQRPGGNNALGPVKFVLPNTMNIYLHGTPAQQLFSQTRRDFSHGCIRVEDPPALAAFVLSDQPEWTQERIAQAMDAGKMSIAKLTRPIPVVIFYTTAIVDAKNRVLFQSDIYGYDAKLEAALKAR